MELELIEEGKTTLWVPIHDSTATFPPGSAPIFYNPRMALNRDATVIVAACTEPRTYLDAMGASGIRGCRVGYETGTTVTINDRDPDATTLIKKNIDHLGIDASATCRDANALMSEEPFDFVDLDPFGTPAPFIDAGIRSSVRMIGITATDTAPLCGAHLKAGIRRYMARPMNTDYHAEVGLRILLGYAARMTARYDRGIIPQFCFAHEHFVRLHLKLARGTQAADQTLAQMGYIYQCTGCPYRTEGSGFFPEPKVCPHCGKQLNTIGPLWTGAIQDPEFLSVMNERLPGSGISSPDELGKILTCCMQEPVISFSYDYHKLAKAYRVSPGPIAGVLESLQNMGYSASRVHYSGYCIKTNAPLETLRDCLTAQ
ncbi:tRNA (guanine(10)-N(2))-dimethyltransferase [Methanospirillum lacunae]|uniref:tRNA (guanine(26)-N(2))-dimethyltransferase n=1 Tax=Methanospirillum lacunae TaxID=668570 RepID=A0A2V2NC34_9EURY|nr:tRNA (guanine(10)-N(2))-dimethyltransferase [Methanospirillum lacunae]PWR74018.1 tRNA (guanine(10)-N(2))-dimethyltransferase [Methanospirillum lacunae]